MPMTAPGKFDSNGAWDGFRGEIWQEEINVRDLSRKTIPHMMATNHFWLILQSVLRSYGIMSRSFRKKNVKKAAFWNVRQKLFPTLPHMDLATSARI